MNAFEMLLPDQFLAEPLLMTLPEESPLNSPDFPPHASVDCCPHGPFCGAYFEQGCLADPSHWVPVRSVLECPRPELWRCDECDRHHRGWCREVPGRGLTNIEIMGHCRVANPMPDMEGEPWDWDPYAKNNGCYGCNFFDPHAGYYVCGYDGQQRTLTDQTPCPLGPAAVANR